jgi:hypothetical protein
MIAGEWLWLWVSCGLGATQGVKICEIPRIFPC